MPREYSTVSAAVDAIRRGEIVIVVDAEDRENEGDYICAAEKATTANVNFILNGRGQLCVPLLPDDCRRLDLSPVVDSNTAPLGTAFLTPIDHRTAKTGITAEERARTIRAIVDSDHHRRRFRAAGTCLSVAGKRGGRAAPRRSYRIHCGSVPHGRTSSVRSTRRSAE